MKSNSTLIKKLFENLWPINRSITGRGFLLSLKIIKKKINSLKIKKIKTGTKVFDWKIPQEWNVKNAWIKDHAGNEIVNLRNNNLHLVGYSKPINKTLNYSKLEKHIHTLKKYPNAIPYVTSYYKKNWGFCIKDNLKKKLNKKGKYKVYIDSKFSNGHLRYGEVLIRGKSKKEIFFSTYLCHPSLANNELSGPILTTILINWLKRKKRNYTYRLVFIPETIGSIAYLHKNIDKIKKKIIAGFVVTCVGDERNFSYLSSRLKNTVSDKVILRILKKNKIKYKTFNWLDRGSDERQYCSPGIDLPVASLMRSKYGTYKEYHNSMDKFGTVVTTKGILETLNIYKQIIQDLEKREFPITKVNCEPNLGKRHLYPAISKAESNRGNSKRLLDILSYCDGSKSLEEICSILSINSRELNKNLNILKKSKLVY